jgi:Ca2+-binding EF-hand superfamily protein
MSNPRRRVERYARRMAVLFACISISFVAQAQDAPRTPRDYLQRMDTDGDGRVSRAEYIAYMMRGFDRMDADHNGVLEGDELPPGARRVTRADYEKSLAAAFARQDTNHDGFLDEHELARPPR